MAAVDFLVSTVVMGLFLLATIAFVRSGDWRAYSPPEQERSLGSTVAGIARSPVAWIVGFLVAAFAAGGAAVLFVGGGLVAGGPELTPTLQQLAGLVIGGVFALAIFLFFLLGSYASARGRGLKSAQAAGVTAALFGLLFVVVISVKLLIA